MKICTECDRSFDDAQRFCQFDGTLLVDETKLLRATLPEASDSHKIEEAVPDEMIEWVPVSSSKTVWLTLPLGILIGLVLSLCAYMVWLSSPLAAGKRTHDQPALVKRQFENRRASEVGSFKAQSTTPPLEQTRDEAEADSTPVIPSSETPRPGPAPLRLNQGPISTGSQKDTQDGRVLIKLKEAGSVEADAAWEDGENLWYRRGSLVSSVKRNRVEAITQVPEPKPAPSERVKP